VGEMAGILPIYGCLTRVLRILFIGYVLRPFYATYMIYTFGEFNKGFFSYLPFAINF
jgi:hypothetical protein